MTKVDGKSSKMVARIFETMTIMSIFNHKNGVLANDETPEAVLDTGTSEFIRK